MNQKQLIVAWIIVTLLLGGCSKPDDIMAIRGTWEPLSEVYDNFRRMAINDNTIEWSSGQKVSFRIIRVGRDGIIIKIINKNPPKFHETTYKFIKFDIKEDADFKRKNLEVSFYETAEDLDNRASMWGVYVRPET